MATIAGNYIYTLARQWWWEPVPAQQCEISESSPLLEVIVLRQQGRGKPGAGLSAPLAFTLNSIPIYWLV